MGSAEPLKIGYDSPAAPADAWRVYDRQNPEPGYFEFDWISAYHPDLYHRFALSTDGLLDELPKLVDLTGLDVVDIGAGTGRSTLGAARTAKHVYAVDAYRSVVEFGRNEVSKAGLTNVTYEQGDRAALPLDDESVDVALNTWAEFDPKEMYRVLKPGGWVVIGACAPGSLMGELTEVLSPSYQDFVSEVAAREKYRPRVPARRRGRRHGAVAWPPHQMDEVPRFHPRRRVRGPERADSDPRKNLRTRRGEVRAGQREVDPRLPPADLLRAGCQVNRRDGAVIDRPKDFSG